MEIITEGKMPELPQENRQDSPAAVGIAVDIGTTTVVVSMWSLAGRKHLSSVAEKNSQVRYGYDVIKRISFAVRPPLTGSSAVVESGPSALHYSIVSQLEKMFIKAAAQAAVKLPRGLHPEIKSMVITGNTTMLSFLCAVPVKNMASAPFTPGSKFDFTTSWDQIRKGQACEVHDELDKPTAEVLHVFSASIIPAQTPVYIPPCIGAFIGADTVCAMISAGFPVPRENQVSLHPWESAVTAPLMLADVGTNSEIALFLPDSDSQKSRILCTAAAAGPAFEAANISCGMSAIDGAIDSVKIEKGKIIPHVIGSQKARGICGSGLVSLVAALYENRFIDKNGVILKNKSRLGDGSTCIQITPAVYISQQDIRNLQLAKSAVNTGLQYLLERSGTLPVFCISGGFGSKIDLYSAAKIGLFPTQLADRTVQIGNGALAGASALLFSDVLRQKASSLAKYSYQINLAAVPEFQDRFLKSIDFD